MGGRIRFSFPSWMLCRFACSSETEIALAIDEHKMKNASRANAASQTPVAKEFFEASRPEHNETVVDMFGASEIRRCAHSESGMGTPNPSSGLSQETATARDTTRMGGCETATHWIKVSCVLRARRGIALGRLHKARTSRGYSHFFPRWA